ncbi:MAG: Gfo/Idh/MocA family oxidoreductase [Clostridiales bacterium]|jgi:predicted dehydrogenase|nr:Gfo/Idh/MocA family oxidoreductase [Clostridiales bacterium]
MRVAVFGTGYWAGFQAAAWQAVGVEVAGAWNRSYDRAAAFCARFGIKKVFKTAEEAFIDNDFDVADIITDPAGHLDIARLCAKFKKPMICQKPLANTAEECAEIARLVKMSGIWAAVHENFRYQPQYTAFQKILAESGLGGVLRADIQMRSPDRAILLKQPALSVMPHMVLRDMGPHIFDTMRFLFGEAETIAAVCGTVTRGLRVPDTAVSVLKLRRVPVVSCMLVNRPVYRVAAECENGTLVLDEMSRVVKTQNGKTEVVYDDPPERLSYIPDEDWKVHGAQVFHSIPACLSALKSAFTARKQAETSLADNIESMRLVFAAIRSSDEKREINREEITI